MEKTTLILLIWLGVVCAPILCTAQQLSDTFSIKLIARSLPEGIALRWAPLDAKTWKAGIKTGYRLSRTTLANNAGILPRSEQEAGRRILADHIFPVPEPGWQAIADTNQTAVIAAGALYSRSFSVRQEVIDEENDPEAAEMNRFGFGLFAADQFMGIAIAMGLGWIDTSATEGESYLYTVTLMNGPSLSKINPGTVKITKGDTLPLPPPGQLTGRFGDRRVRLKWDRSAVESVYTAYFVERSFDHGRTIEPANKLPLIYTTPEGTNDPFMYFTDTIPENHMPVCYRIRGKTPFGELGRPSAWITGEGRPAPLPYQPMITGLTDNGQGGLLITWAVPETAKSQISGFDILRSETAEGPFRAINRNLIGQPESRFTDEHPIHLAYYRIQLTDQNGHQVSGPARLALLKDDMPPETPLAIGGSLLPGQDSIEISWHPSPDADCYGYRIYCSNGKDNDYLQLTREAVTDTFYRLPCADRKNRERLFFRIKAVDYRGNYSSLSNPVCIAFPDDKPPSPPVFKSIRNSPSGVELTWANSSSPDLKRQILEKRTAEPDTWIEVQEWIMPDFTTRYLDTLVVEGTDVAYRIKAVDDAGLTACSEQVTGTRIDAGIHGVISAFRVIRSFDKKSIRLQWTYPDMESVESFIVYRSTGSNPPATYLNLVPDNKALAISGNRAEYSDQTIQPDRHYRYQVIARLKTGGYSLLSPEIAVKDF
ncbi:MAG TPA: hypothetical protein PKB07_19310 [Flavilitoribacter sp.]|nr:hypothetical protein [Flavilitoribacter sp.]